MRSVKVYTFSFSTCLSFCVALAGGPVCAKTQASEVEAASKDQKITSDIGKPAPVRARAPVPLSQISHTSAELELGFLTLPDAPILKASQGVGSPFGTIGRGNTILMTGLHLLFRARNWWELGAGLKFSPFGASDSQYGGEGKLSRTHERAYYLISGEIRFYPFRFSDFDFFLGLNSGMVIVADRFSTEGGEVAPPVYGRRQNTVSSEGFLLGGQVGVNWHFSERFYLSALAKGNGWFLPDSVQCTPLSDCATLHGSVLSIEFGLSIGYLIPL